MSKSLRQHHKCLIDEELRTEQGKIKEGCRFEATSQEIGIWWMTSPETLDTSLDGSAGNVE